MNDQTNAVRPWWMEALLCPYCHDPVRSAIRCSKCGVTFEQDDGTPVLIDCDAVGVVSFKFPQHRAERSAMSGNFMSIPQSLLRENLTHRIIWTEAMQQYC